MSSGSTAATSASPHAAWSWLSLRSEVGLIVAVAAICLLTVSLDSQHTYWHKPGPSAVDILRQTTTLGIFALGAAIVIIAGGIDLSSGSVIAFSGAVCGSLLLWLAPEEMKNNEPLPLLAIAGACAGALLSGFLVGTLHAWLITVVGLPPFVATLATLVGLRSLSRALVAFVNQGSTQIPVFDPRFRYLATSVWIPAVLCVLVTVLAWVLMSRTVTGRHLYALGGNEAAAKLSGIRTEGIKWLAYCLSAILSSLAGIILFAEVAVIEPESQGKGYELYAIAAAVVGGCSLQGGIGTISGTLLGALFLRLVMDGVAKVIKVSSDVYEGLIVGGVVVVAVAFTQLWQARRQGKQFFPGMLGWVTIFNLALLAGLLAMVMSPTKAVSSTTLGTAVAAFALLVLLFARFVETRRDQPRESK